MLNPVLSPERAVKQEVPYGSFDSPFVEVVGHPDNKVPPGEQIELHAFYTAAYPGQPWYAPEWTCSAVAYNEALTEVLGQDDTTHLVEGPVTNDPYFTIGPMPSSPIWVGVVLWANPDAWLTFPNDGGNWTQIDFRWLYIEPGPVIIPEWEPLFTTEAVVKKGQVVTEWEPLFTTEASVKHKEFTIPPDFKKVLDKVYPDGKTYNGLAERIIAEFKLAPEQIPNQQWWAETLMADKLVSEVEAQGAKMLTLKVYENTVPTLWTEYVLIAEATKPAAAARAVASPLAWSAIILAALAIIGIIAFYFFFLHPVLEFIYKSPGAAIGIGIILIGLGALAVLGIAAYKGTSVEEAVTGRARG